MPAISCDPNYFAGRRPSYVPFTPQLLTTWLGRSQAYAQDCASRRARRRRRCCRHMTHGDSARTWTASAQALGQQQITLLRVLLRHVPRPGLRDPVPVARPPDDPGQQRRSARRLVPGQPRPGRRVQPQHQHLVRAGWRSTTASITWEHRRRRSQDVLHRRGAARAASGRRGGRSRRVDRRLPRAGYYQQTWRGPGRRCSPTGSTTTMPPRRTS